MPSTVTTVLPSARTLPSATPWAGGAVFEGWKNSAGHRKNMLNNQFEAIGIGRAYKQTSTYDWYWTTTFGGEVIGKEVRC